tara:strand:+ start:15395 stop:16180 length:786 start_codon:yes stop_codon:yes gene_type:complete
MKFAPVISEKYDPAKYTDYHLILANEVVDTHSYANYYSSLDNSHTIILDSGTVEIGYADAEMIQAASEILNKEVIIVAPDFLGDKVRTITETEKFLEQDWCPVKNNIMIVPQGETPEEWISCFDYLDLHYSERFKWVGIPRISEDFVGGRSWLYQNVMQIHRRRRGMNDQPKIHLLGIQHSIDEIEWAKHYSSRIVGVDSSAPLKAAEARLSCAYVKDYRNLTDIDVDPPHELVVERIQEMVDYASFKWSIKSHEDLQNGA